MLYELLKAFWIPLSIWAFTHLRNLYRQTIATYRSNKSHIKPTPSPAQLALNVLFASALFFLTSTFFPPENIFKLTQSRLQTPVDVLFTRLRANRELTALDETLQQKLQSRDGKLLYLAYGPSVVGNCQFCTPSEPGTYLLYALPSAIAPHLLHAFVLGAVTSALLGGGECARWRPHALLATLALAVAEAYVLGTYDVTANVTAVRGSDLDFFHDKCQLYRSLAFVAVDALLAGVIWLSSTGRLFVRPPTTADRMQALTSGVEVGLGRLWAAGAVFNSVSRDRKLRQRWKEYFDMEREVQEDAEYLRVERLALERLDLRQLGAGAEKRAGDVEKVLRDVVPQGAGL